MSSNIVYMGGKRYKWVDQFAKSDEWKAILAWADYEGAPPPTNDIPFDQLIKDLKSAGIWQKLDVFYVFAGDGSPLFKELNWIDPSKHMASAYGGLTWDLNGVKGNGVNGYIDTNFNPVDSSVNYTLDNASLFIGIAEYNGLDSGRYGITNAGRYTNFINTHVTINGGRNDRGVSINGATSGVMFTPSTPSINMSGTGMKYLGREDETTIHISNKSDIVVKEQPSTVVHDGNQVMLRHGTSYNASTINCFGMGAYLTYSETQILRVAFNKFLASLGLTPTV